MYLQSVAESKAQIQVECSNFECRLSMQATRSSTKVCRVMVNELVNLANCAESFILTRCPIILTNLHDSQILTSKKVTQYSLSLAIFLCTVKLILILVTTSDETRNIKYKSLKRKNTFLRVLTVELWLRSTSSQSGIHKCNAFNS